MISVSYNHTISAFGTLYGEGGGGLFFIHVDLFFGTIVPIHPFLPVFLSHYIYMTDLKF